MGGGEENMLGRVELAIALVKKQPEQADAPSTHFRHRVRTLPLPSSQNMSCSVVATPKKLDALRAGFGLARTMPLSSED
jgi:hypothetical protein